MSKKRDASNSSASVPTSSSASTSTSTSTSTSSTSSSSSPSSSLSVFQDALSIHTNTQVAVDQRLNATQKRLEAEFLAWDECVKEYTTQLNEYNKLERMWSECYKEMLSMKKGDEQKHMQAILDEARVKLAVAKTKCDRLREIKPNHRSLFVRLMMGKVNVHMWKKADRMTFKDEYNKFKNRTTWLFMLFPFIQLFLLPDNIILQTVHQIWLIYYYLSLALRENILLGNGSNIKLWWIYHHYVSMAMAMCFLLWKPMDPYLNSKSVPFLLFGLAQGLIMLVQNHYQSRRNYVRKSLGKAGTIDVDSTETLVEKPTDLKILVPLLFLLYGFEAFASFEFLYNFYMNPDATVISLFMGIGFAVLCIGNTVTTALVLIGKSKLRQLKRLIVSQRDR